jgi:uncharacterized protein
MHPRISFITLGVDDLERSLAFYREGLGLPSEGIVGTEFEQGAVAFFGLQPGLRLALWPRRSIARETGLPLGEPSSTEFTLSHNVASQEEVDAVMAQAERAGATIVKPAQDTFWGGYAGYFLDPDRHLWEVVFNPEWHVGYEAATICRTTDSATDETRIATDAEREPGPRMNPDYANPNTSKIRLEKAGARAVTHHERSQIMNLRKPTFFAALALLGTLAVALAETPAGKEPAATGFNAYYLYTGALEVSNAGVAHVPSRFQWSAESSFSGQDARGKDLPDSRIMLRLYDPDHNFTALTAQMDLATAAKLHHELGEMLAKKREDPSFQHRPRLYDPKDIPTKRFVGVDEDGNVIVEDVDAAK